jgi:hypothetical protein
VHTRDSNTYVVIVKNSNCTLRIYNHPLYLTHEHHFDPIIPVILNFVLCVKVRVSHLAQKIMEKVEKYYLVRDINLILEIVLVDLNQCGNACLYLSFCCQTSRPSLALIVYKAGRHVNISGFIFHGPLYRDAIGPCAKKIPYICNEILQQTMSMIYLGIQE